jgi:hypothetical protein
MNTDWYIIEIEVVGFGVCVWPTLVEVGGDTFENVFDHVSISAK